MLGYAAGPNGSGAAQSVQVTVERGARNSRRLYASVQIAAPVEVVWGALTDYQGLDKFIPGALSYSCMHQQQACLAKQSLRTIMSSVHACRADLMPAEQCRLVPLMSTTVCAKPHPSCIHDCV